MACDPHPSHPTSRAPDSETSTQDAPLPSHPLKAVPIAVADEGESESEDDDLKPRGSRPQKRECCGQGRGPRLWAGKGGLECGGMPACQSSSPHPPSLIPHPSPGTLGRPAPLPPASSSVQDGRWAGLGGGQNSPSVGGTQVPTAVVSRKHIHLLGRFLG